MHVIMCIKRDLILFTSRVHNFKIFGFTSKRWVRIYNPYFHEECELTGGNHERDLLWVSSVRLVPAMSGIFHVENSGDQRKYISSTTFCGAIKQASSTTLDSASDHYYCCCNHSAVGCWLAQVASARCRHGITIDGDHTTTKHALHLGWDHPLRCRLCGDDDSGSECRQSTAREEIQTHQLQPLLSVTVAMIVNGSNIGRHTDSLTQTLTMMNCWMSRCCQVWSIKAWLVWEWKQPVGDAHIEPFSRQSGDWLKCRCVVGPFWYSKVCGVVDIDSCNCVVRSKGLT